MNRNLSVIGTGAALARESRGSDPQPRPERPTRGGGSNGKGGRGKKENFWTPQSRKPGAAPDYSLLMNQLDGLRSDVDVVGLLHISDEQK